MDARHRVMADPRRACRYGVRADDHRASDYSRRRTVFDFYGDRIMRCDRLFFRSGSAAGYPDTSHDRLPP